MKQLNLTNNEFVVLREVIGSLTKSEIEEVLKGSKVEFEDDSQRVSEITNALEKLSGDFTFTPKLYDKFNKTLLD